VTISIWKSSHVIPALIRKCVGSEIRPARRKWFAWGTGSATREFLYVEDAAGSDRRRSGKKYEKADPVNLGSGEEISIRALLEQISEACGYRGPDPMGCDKNRMASRVAAWTPRAPAKEFGWAGLDSFSRRAAQNDCVV